MNRIAKEKRSNKICEVICAYLTILYDDLATEKLGGYESLHEKTDKTTTPEMCEMYCFNEIKNQCTGLSFLKCAVLLRLVNKKLTNYFNVFMEENNLSQNFGKYLIDNALDVSYEFVDKVLDSMEGKPVKFDFWKKLKLDHLPSIKDQFVSEKLVKIYNENHKILAEDYATRDSGFVTQAEKEKRLKTYKTIKQSYNDLSKSDMESMSKYIQLCKIRQMRQDDFVIDGELQKINYLIMKEKFEQRVWPFEITDAIAPRENYSFWTTYFLNNNLLQKTSKNDESLSM